MKDSKIFKLIGGSVGIYASYLILAIYQEKMYLTEFPSIEQRGLKEKFKYTTVFVILTTLVSYLTGVVIAKVQKDPSDKVPLKEKTLLGALFFTTVFATSTSLLYVSYPLHLLTRNLRLLSIFVVGVFFSRLKAVGKGHLGKQKLLIGLVITAGVLIFNSSQSSKEKESHDSSWPGYVLLVVATLTDGFFLDSQAYNKKVYHPSGNELFMATNGIACAFAVVYSVIIGELPKAINFVLTHKQIGTQLVMMSLLGTMGQLSIYYIVKHFEPYVTAIITTIRKVLTVLLSVVFFRHDLNAMQWLGIGVVFLGVAFETVDELNSKRKLEGEHAKAQGKQHQPQHPSQHPAPQETHKSESKNDVKLKDS